MFKYKPHPFPKEIEIAVFKDQNGKCCHCGVVINLVRDRPDHIIPQTKMHVKIYSEERIQSKENCQIPCLNCHANKGSWSTQKIKDLKLKWEPFNKSKLNTMKTAILTLLLFVTTLTFADIPGEPIDKPSGYTSFGFRLYNSGAYPSADSLNQNTIDIDREIHNSRLINDTPLYVSAVALALSLIALLISTRRKTEESY